MPTTPNDLTYNHIEFYKLSNNKIQFRLLDGMKTVYQKDITITEIAQDSKLYNECDLHLLFNDSSVLTSFSMVCNLVTQIPEEWSVSILLKNSVLSTLWTYNSSDNEESFGGNPSRFSLHPSGIISSKRWCLNGKLHNTTGPAKETLFGGSVFKEYYFNGEQIPLELFTDGLADETHITEEVLVTMTLLDK